MNVFLLTAEASTELAEVLKDLTKEEALMGGTVAGFAIGTVLMGALVLFLLQVIADWKIFTKAGRPGWKSIVPILNYYEEYDLSWSGKGMFGICYIAIQIAMSVIDYYTKDPQPMWALIVTGVLAIICLVITVKQSLCMAKAFGKGVGFAIGLIFLQPLFRLILAFGSSRYQGAQR